MTSEILSELLKRRNFLKRILGRFQPGRHRIDIRNEDDPVYRQTVNEIVDLLDEEFGSNRLSWQIEHEFQEGLANYLQTPSYKSVENIIGLVGAAITKLSRRTQSSVVTEAPMTRPDPKNIFIVHGRDEARWRELKELIETEFGLNPIVLQEQPALGSLTLIEKFEHYASTCSFAIAVFTPDDEVTADGETYLQARPNTIFELGWFCGRLSRSNVMLLLKKGTSVLSDFQGVVQKRFEATISERVAEIRNELVQAGLLPP